MRILLNVGCGQIRPYDWVNADVSFNSLVQKIPFVCRFIHRYTKLTRYQTANADYMDIGKPWHMPSNNADVVYASHVLEHLSSSATNIFMKEARRVLKPGGTIRIVVPDLYMLAKEYIAAYEKKDNESGKRFLASLNLHKAGAYGQQCGRLARFLHHLQNYPHQHKYMHDAHSLSALLSEYGFINIVECRYGSSSYIPEIKQVEMTQEGIVSIYIEGRKSLS